MMRQIGHFLLNSRNSIDLDAGKKLEMIPELLFSCRKNSPPPGRGLPQCVGLQGFQFLRQLQGKAR